MRTFKILMPYNFSAKDRKGLSFISDVFLGQSDVQITLFHTYTPLPKIDIKANPEVLKLMDGMRHLNSELEEKKLGLQSAKEVLTEKGFPYDRVDYVLKKKTSNTTDETIQMIKANNYNILVLSGAPGKVTQFFTRSVHDKILASVEGITVCIAT